MGTFWDILEHSGLGVFWSDLGMLLADLGCLGVTAVTTVTVVTVVTVKEREEKREKGEEKLARTKERVQQR